MLDLLTLALGNDMLDNTNIIVLSCVDGIQSLKHICCFDKGSQLAKICRKSRVDCADSQNIPGLVCCVPGCFPLQHPIIFTPTHALFPLY